MPLFNGLSNRHLHVDFTGGLTSAVVALPLALAFGVVSGAGPSAGVYGAIFVGFFAALFGGTPQQVSGPTGPMTVVMAGVFTSLQARHPETGLIIGFSAVILAGLMQIIFGLMKLGKYFILVPYPVISGFMSGVGVIIIILQVGPLLGHSGTMSLPETLKLIPMWIGNINLLSLMLGIITLALMYLWPARLSKLCPPPLAALAIGIFIALLLLPNDSVQLLGDIPSGFPVPHWPVFSIDVMAELLYAAVLLAILGSIDSLLTSLICDSITKGHHDSDKELIGQGIGNTFAGIFGGLPGAGATMRSVVNIRAGGKTGFSGATHSLLLLAVMLGAGQYASYIPLAALAGILLHVGLSIMDWPMLIRLKKLPANTIMMMMMVLLMTVFVDLITAVLVGVFISSLITLERLTNIQLDHIYLSDGSVEAGSRNASIDGYDVLDNQVVQPIEARYIEQLSQYQGAVLLMKLVGPLSFGVGRGLHRYLKSYQSYQLIVIDMTGAQLVGTSTAMLLDQLVRTEIANAKEVYLVGVSKKSVANLDRFGTLVFLGEEHIFRSMADAMDRVDSAIKFVH